MAITLDDIKKLSPLLKALIVCLIYVLFGYGYYVYFIQADIETSSNLRTKLKELEQQISDKERLAAELGKYAKGADTLKETFQAALTKLPVRKEIPGLLNSVALAGKNAGIAFITFEPQPTVKKPIGGTDAGGQKPPEQKPADKKPEGAKSQAAKPAEEEEYYEEIPVKVTVNGSFQSTAGFFQSVAKLPRIINIEDISIEEAKGTKGKGLILTTSCIIKTYMFVQKKAEKGKRADEKNK